LQGPQGPKGDQGPQGEKGASAYQTALQNGFTGTAAEWLATLVGPQGPKGDPEVVSVQVRESVLTTIPGKTDTTVDAKCNPGEKALSGGYIANGNSINSFKNAPLTDGSLTPTGWSVAVSNNAAAAGNIKVYVVCSG
jgi:hypothetical protein